MVKYLAAIPLVFATVMIGAGRQVPAYLVSLADRPPLEFAFLLASASIPSGIEVRQPDDTYPGPPRAGTQPSERTVSAEELMQAFNAAHEDYRAVLMDGVFVIRPVRGRSAFLDVPSSIDPPTTVAGTMEAERRIFSPLDPRLLGPAIGGGIGREAARGLSTHFILDGTAGRRVIDTLNQIVLQMPGAWQVTTGLRGKEPTVVEFGLIYADRSRSMHPLSKT